MSVTQVGTPTAPVVQTGSLTPSVTGTWSGTQPRTLGDCLVACVTTFGSTGSGTISTPSGWTQDTQVNASSTVGVNCAIFWKLASGSDGAPTFSSTNTGSGASSEMVVELFEFTGNDPTTPIPVGVGGTATATTAEALSVVTAGNIPAAGCYAVSAFSIADNTSGANTTFSPGSGFSNVTNNGAGTTLRLWYNFDQDSSPSSGSTLTDALTWNTATKVSAGCIIVIQPPTGQSFSGSPSTGVVLGSSVTGAKAETQSVTQGIVLGSSVTGAKRETKSVTQGILLGSSALGVRKQTSSDSDSLVLGTLIAGAKRAIGAVSSMLQMLTSATGSVGAGATLTGEELSGTITVTNAVSASMTQTNSVDASITQSNTLEGKMALNVALNVIESNLVELSGQVLNDDKQPFNLTGFTLSFVLKASSTATDGSGVTIVPTVVSESIGTYSLSIPGTDLATAPATMWYRLDVVDADSNHVTALFGPVGVLAV